MICTAMETSQLTAEGIIGEAVRIGARMSGGEFPIEVFPIRIQRIISSLHDCQLASSAGETQLVGKSHSVHGIDWSPRS